MTNLAVSTTVVCFSDTQHAVCVRRTSATGGRLILQRGMNRRTRLWRIHRCVPRECICCRTSVFSIESEQRHLGCLFATCSSNVKRSGRRCTGSHRGRRGGPCVEICLRRCDCTGWRRRGGCGGGGGGGARADSRRGTKTRQHCKGRWQSGAGKNSRITPPGCSFTLGDMP